MKYLTLMISLVTLFLCCARTHKLPDMGRSFEILDTGERKLKGAWIKFSAYKLGKRDSIFQFECNCDSIILSDSDFSLMEEVKNLFKDVSVCFSFATCDGKINFIFSLPASLPGRDEIRGNFPKDSFFTNAKICSQVYKTVYVDSTIEINNGRSYNITKQVNIELSEEEYSMVNKLFDRVKPLMLKYGVKLITNCGEKGFKIKSTWFQYERELLISCDPENEYIKIFGDWYIHRLPNNLIW